MTKLFCDLCGINLAESNSENLFNSREFEIVIRDALEPIREAKLTMCHKCKKGMYYLVRNPHIMVDELKITSFANQIRFLFLRDMKLPKEET